jgi:hypothetical protein
MHRAPSSLRSPTLRRAWAVRFDRRQRSGSGRLEASFVPPLCYPCSWLTGEEIRGRGVGIAVTGGWGCGAANRPPTATGARRANLANTGARRTHGPGDSERLSGATRPASGALAFTRHHQRAGRDGGLESNSGRRLSGPAAGLPIGGLTDAALAPGPTARLVKSLVAARRLQQSTASPCRRPRLWPQHNPRPFAGCQAAVAV